MDYLKVPVASFRDFAFGKLSLSQQALVLRLRALQAEIGYLPLDLGAEIVRMGGRRARDLEPVSAWFPIDPSGQCRQDPDVEKARGAMVDLWKKRVDAGRAGGEANAGRTRSGQSLVGERSESGQSSVRVRQAPEKHVLPVEAVETRGYDSGAVRVGKAFAKPETSPFPPPPPREGEEGGTSAAAPVDAAAAEDLPLREPIPGDWHTTKASFPPPSRVATSPPDPEALERKRQGFKKLAGAGNSEALQDPDEAARLAMSERA